MRARHLGEREKGLQAGDATGGTHGKLTPAVFVFGGGCIYSGDLRNSIERTATISKDACSSRARRGGSACRGHNQRQSFATGGFAATRERVSPIAGRPL